ncbi:MAG: biotin--[acetyl-CoA-carboxylase] ligase [Candidatus Dormibacteria bacterium]
MTSSSQDLVAAGRAAFPAFALRRLARTPSTQDVVRLAARAGAGEGFCCIAGEQGAGRGRQGRNWVAPPGSALLCSLLLRRRPEAAGGVPIAAGIAVADAVAAVSGVDSGLKWPNDVLVNGSKLAGILVEVESQAADAIVVGIGVNLTVDVFPPGVIGVSLHQLVATPPAADDVLAAVLPALRRRLDELTGGGVAALRSAWRERAIGIGGPVRANIGGAIVTGAAIDIDDDGALLVATSDGLTRLIAGEVHIGS